MTWKLRDDVGPSERCYVGTDKEGRTFGYLQEFPNGTAGYWFQPMGQATAAGSRAEAERAAARRAYPLRIFAFDEQGVREDIHENVSGDPSEPRFDPFEEASQMAQALSRHVRGHGGFANFGDPRNPVFVLRTKARITHVAVIANDGTELLRIDCTPFWIT